MKKISSDAIIKAVSELVVKTSRSIPEEAQKALHDACKAKNSKLGKKYLRIILQNLKAAEKEKIPLCQDTGLSIILVEQGCDITVHSGKYSSIEDIINEGLQQGSKKGYLRNSVVSSVRRENTGTNTPGIVHLLPGKKGEFKITLLAKGFGSENTSKLAMLNPSAGKTGIEGFIIETVKQAGSLPCPPIFAGVGIGGSFEKAALLAKTALCRIGEKSANRAWEKRMVKKINAETNIGPGGFGGETSVLDMRIETYPTHIAGLPVAVNISCWAHRCEKISL